MTEGEENVLVTHVFEGMDIEAARLVKSGEFDSRTALAMLKLFALHVEKYDHVLGATLVATETEAVIVNRAKLDASSYGKGSE